MQNAQWELCQQLCKWKGVEFYSLVKTLKFRPVHRPDGTTGFVRLKWDVRQILLNIVGDSTEQFVKVTLCNGNYKVKFPDSVQPKCITIGEGRLKRKALDRLHPGEVVVKGATESFPDLSTLCQYLVKRFGADVGRQVGQLL
jgi:hypothetical protein